MQISCGIIYMFFSDSNLQPWNKPAETVTKENSLKEKELKPVLETNNNTKNTIKELINEEAVSIRL